MELNGTHVDKSPAADVDKPSAEAAEKRPEYWYLVHVDCGQPSKHRMAYEGHVAADAMTAWSAAVLDGADYVCFETLRERPR